MTRACITHKTTKRNTEKTVNGTPRLWGKLGGVAPAILAGLLILTACSDSVLGSAFRVEADYDRLELVPIGKEYRTRAKSLRAHAHT